MADIRVLPIRSTLCWLVLTVLIGAGWLATDASAAPASVPATTVEVVEATAPGLDVRTGGAHRAVARRLSRDLPASLAVAPSGEDHPPAWAGILAPDGSQEIRLTRVSVTPSSVRLARSAGRQPFAPRAPPALPIA